MKENQIESMLSQLITMVGSIQVEQKEIKQELLETQQNLQKLELKSEERHQEILERFKTLERDQDFIWEKAFEMKGN
ncbi:hypothetical protein [Bacillus andreraoultii]|uniref:hypothetical protein n=1 Tax=Bacillus andreraoultii TaxID=1499685 RepID=UPI00053B69C4|nr:hypothetical protein [Bacillus andreraoultii]